MALPGIFDKSILYPIDRVTGIEHRLVDYRIFLGRDIACLILQDRECDPQRHGRPVSGRSGDDTVVVIRKHLCFLQSLSAARRASVPIGELRRISVKSLDDCLRLDRHLMFRPIPEVNQLFLMAQRKAAAATNVPGIGRARHVSTPKRFRHGGITDHARPAAIAHRLIFAVPARNRQPDFNFDVGIARGLQRCSQPAKRRELFESRILLRGAAAGGWQ